MSATLTFPQIPLPLAFRSAAGPRRRPMTFAAFSTAGSPPSAARRAAASPYEVLRLKETASAGEIKAAYRALAKRCHPDVAAEDGGDGTEFLEIQKAYATLSDPAARAEYDRRSVVRWNGNGLGFVSADETRFRSRRWETDQCW